MPNTHPDRDLAERIKTFLDEHPSPHEATVAAIAKGLVEDTEDVQRVLSEWLRDGDKLAHIGPGGGGNWALPPDEEQP